MKAPWSPFLNEIFLAFLTGKAVPAIPTDGSVAKLETDDDVGEKAGSTAGCVLDDWLFFSAGFLAACFGVGVCGALRPTLL